MSAIFIVNPNSAAVTKKGSILEKVTDEKEIPLHTLFGIEHLPALIETIAKNNHEWVFIEGGDGTVHNVLTAFMQAKHKFPVFPRFSLIPGGMTNQVARHIGLNRPSPNRILAMLDGEKTLRKPTPLLQLDIEGGAPLFGFLFSTGGLPMATQYYFDQVHSHGRGGARAVVSMLAKGFGGRQAARDEIYQASKMSLRITGEKDETHLEGEHLVSVVTPLPGLMLGLDPFWGDGNGPLKITYAHGHAIHLVRNLASIWAGRKSKDRSADGFESFCAQTLRYKYDGPVVLDGEAISLPKGRLVIRATEPLEFIC